jgi:hypothetical protein
MTDVSGPLSSISLRVIGSNLVLFAKKKFSPVCDSMSGHHARFENVAFVRDRFYEDSFWQKTFWTYYGPKISDVNLPVYVLWTTDLDFKVHI